MKYTKKQFFADVKAEADAIKANATKKQIKKLNFYTFDATDYDKCIYGQMTGNCQTLEATQLIKKCCVKFFLNDGLSNYERNGLAAVKSQVSERLFNELESLYNTRRGIIEYFSAIEVYVMTPNSKSKNLIAYIKGENHELVL